MRLCIDNNFIDAIINLRKRKKEVVKILNVKKFRAVLILKGKTLNDISKLLNINIATLYRKLNGESDFYRNEIDAISKDLNLSLEEIEEIFFAQ